MAMLSPAPAPGALAANPAGPASPQKTRNIAPEFDPRTWQRPKRPAQRSSPLDVLQQLPPALNNRPSANLLQNPGNAPSGELSGAHWVAQFPTSTALADLAPAFQHNVRNFLAALVAAGATYEIAATYRPVERAYLMHYAWCIAQENLDPATVPALTGVNIRWLHPNDPDRAKSRAAAAAMVAAYDIVYKPSLTSRHIERLAIDVRIEWTAALHIVDGAGATVVINTAPRTGAGNPELHAVGASYGVHKLVADAPHWSSDGH